MKEQLDLFKGNQLRDAGIKQSLDNAEDKHDNWAKSAYDFLLEYIKTNKEFLAEDVRIASTDLVPEPPSKRAWGSIFVMAKKNKIIRAIGYANVKNPKAHRTPATLWSVG